MDENLAEAYEKRGLAYLSQQDTNSALLNFSKAIELAPQSKHIYHTRALVNLSLGNSEAALTDLIFAIEANPLETRYYEDRAKVYLALDDPANAIADLERVLDLTQDQQYATQIRRIIIAIRAGS